MEIKVKANAGNKMFNLEVLTRKEIEAVIENLDTAAVLKEVYESLTPGMNTLVDVNLEDGSLNVYNMQHNSYNLYEDAVRIATFDGDDVDLDYLFHNYFREQAEDILAKKGIEKVEYPSGDYCDNEDNAWTKWETYDEALSEAIRDLKDEADLAQIFADQYWFEMDFDSIKEQLDNFYGKN